MTTSEDVVSGTVCMQCHQFLVSDDGHLARVGFPILCHYCWELSPKKDKDGGLPYYDARTGDVATRDGGQHGN